MTVIQNCQKPNPGRGIENIPHKTNATHMSTPYTRAPEQLSVPELVEYFTGLAHTDNLYAQFVASRRKSSSRGSGSATEGGDGAVSANGQCNATTLPKSPHTHETGSSPQTCDCLPHLRATYYTLLSTLHHAEIDVAAALLRESAIVRIATGDDSAVEAVDPELGVELEMLREGRRRWDGEMRGRWEALTEGRRRAGGVV
ncbi:uncharacterized protein EV422DRAFT_600625 [Fimicolochytrium jonesii]|uniref:uncharacterized protein n=1 Tax=Fimicolochytrium jonesii TaxID=1396493 RepID=UPI0022FE5629|nr:uncharacterized protein EV422DRAFT_600625 [Fimicolochytrium jonesii]KAI8825917.1 hypothetical protein EV422DRAFT_600625 [Fimicolochytrium jonesii]